MKIITNVTFTLQTDLAGFEQNVSGLLYAPKSTDNERHGPQHDAFLWLADANVNEPALRYLIEQGYDADRIDFVPYSSKTNWALNYPCIVPSMECDANGTLIAYSADPQQVPTSHPLDVKLSSSAKSKKRKRGGPRFHKTVILPNDSRDELHIQVYKYFQWLLHKLNENQSTTNGRLKLSEYGLSALAVQSLLSTMETHFPICKSDSESVNEVFRDEYVPLLEHVIEGELGQLTDERLEKTDPSPYHGQWYNFDEMLAKLQDFKQRNGHCNVPCRYKDDRRLGKWVSKLRQKKTELSKKGEEYETPKRTLTSRTLTQERIDRLTAMGFEWRIKTTPLVPWEVRYEELIEFYNTHGKWPSRKNDGAIGVWAHNQRNLFTMKDAHFMEERFAKLDVIVSWLSLFGCLTYHLS